MDEQRDRLQLLFLAGAAVRLVRTLVVAGSGAAGRRGMRSGAAMVAAPMRAAAMVVVVSAAMVVRRWAAGLAAGAMPVWGPGFAMVAFGGRAIMEQGIEGLVRLTSRCRGSIILAI